MKKIEIAALLSAALVGPLVAHSADLWMSSSDTGRRRATDAKRELLQAAGLAELHHRIYSSVGERDWESRVKPNFMMAITRATTADTGDLFPSLGDVVSWARRNPAEACRLLEAAAELNKPRER